MRVREDSRYLHHQGQRVVLLWGLGFRDRPWTPEQGEELIHLRLLAAAAVCLLSSPGLAAEVLRPLNLHEVRVGSEIGRRFAITITNNLLALDADHDFLPPVKAKTAKYGHIGLGKLIDRANHLQRAFRRPVPRRPPPALLLADGGAARELGHGQRPLLTEGRVGIDAPPVEIRIQLVNGVADLDAVVGDQRGARHG